jgi:hypothetical protein
MTVRIVAATMQARRGVNLLGTAQQRILEAQGLLGDRPHANRLGEAAELVGWERDDAEAQLRALLDASRSTGRVSLWSRLLHPRSPGAAAR